MWIEIGKSAESNGPSGLLNPTEGAMMDLLFGMCVEAASDKKKVVLMAL